MMNFKIIRRSLVLVLFRSIKFSYLVKTSVFNVFLGNVFRMKALEGVKQQISLN